MVKPCWKPSSVDGDESNGRFDGLMWHKDLGNQAFGAFSMAVIQANASLEDRSQIESGPLSLSDSGPIGTFVGVYDGHGGQEASSFVNDNLFNNLKRFASESSDGVSERAIKKSYLATEESFLSLVAKDWHARPQIASAGTCCLVGILCNATIYVANAGDSRAVLGTQERATHEIRAVQLSSEHNASFSSVRDELRSAHPHDPNIVVLRHKVWRVKGLIQISRSIGDAYLKRWEFNREPLLPKFRLGDPFFRPILNAEPAITVQRITRQDKFIIFASDGLWEHLTSQEAVDIVNNYPRNGIARRLIKVALEEAAKKRELRYSDLKKIDRGVRRHFHDDISVVVLFLDPNLTHDNLSRVPPVSIKGGIPVPGDS